MPRPAPIQLFSGAPRPCELTINKRGYRSLPVIESRYPGWDDKELAQQINDARGIFPMDRRASVNP